MRVKIKYFMTWTSGWIQSLSVSISRWFGAIPPARGDGVGSRDVSPAADGLRCTDLIHDRTLFKQPALVSVSRR